MRLGRGYDEAAWGGNADPAFNLPHANNGFSNGLAVLLDAILLSKCDYLLVSVSAVAEFALWIAPGLWTNHLNLQVTDRFLSQRMPSWVSHVPGVRSSWTSDGKRKAVARVFCTALSAACANETQRMYKGRFCSRCQAEADVEGKPLDQVWEIHRWNS